MVAGACFGFGCLKLQNGKNGEEHRWVPHGRVSYYRPCHQLRRMGSHERSIKQLQLRFVTVLHGRRRIPIGAHHLQHE